MDIDTRTETAPRPVSQNSGVEIYMNERRIEPFMKALIHFSALRDDIVFDYKRNDTIETILKKFGRSVAPVRFDQRLFGSILESEREMACNTFISIIWNRFDRYAKHHFPATYEHHRIKIEEEMRRARHYNSSRPYEERLRPYRDHRVLPDPLRGFFEEYSQFIDLPDDELFGDANRVPPFTVEELDQNARKLLDSLSTTIDISENKANGTVVKAKSTLQLVKALVKQRYHKYRREMMISHLRT